MELPYGKRYYTNFSQRVTPNLTQLPPREVLEEQLRKAIEIAHEKYARLEILSAKDAILENK